MPKPAKLSKGPNQPRVDRSKTKLKKQKGQTQRLLGHVESTDPENVHKAHPGREKRYENK